MNNIFTDNPDFYPTPDVVIEQMMMDENFVGKTILEPSAGKGNIVDWLKKHGVKNIIACENDPNIRKLLDGKCEIIADDFLTVTSDMISHVDYIVMNPPFSKGSSHILHAYNIAPAGCTIVSLCNSKSTRYDHYHTQNRQLSELVELHGKEEYLGSVFGSAAERTTRCTVSLIKLYKHGDGDNEFANYFFASNDEDAVKDSTSDVSGIMPYSFIREIVSRYVSAVRLFDETFEAIKRINEAATFVDYAQDECGKLIKHEYGCLPISFKAITPNGTTSTVVTHDRYRKELQKYYWRIIFSKLNMQKYATKKLYEDINKFIETTQNKPFTMSNIYRVLDIVIQTNGQRMQKALEEAFDVICSFSAENSTAGEKWKTNANYMVNRKFIVPNITNYNSYGYRNAYVILSLYGNSNTIEDVCKALCYITGTEYDKVGTLDNATRNKVWGEWFEWGFFRCKAFKKGTMHFEFVDENIWLKFNYEVAKNRGWRLPKVTPKENRKRK